MAFPTEPGEWRDISSLEMGFKADPTRVLIACINCKNIISISKSCVGVICNNCGNYNPITSSMWLTDKDAEFISEQKKSAFHIPNKKLLDFRKGMENRAEKWIEKNEQKRKLGHGRQLHGPIDPATGLHQE